MIPCLPVLSAGGTGVETPALDGVTQRLGVFADRFQKLHRLVFGHARRRDYGPVRFVLALRKILGIVGGGFFALAGLRFALVLAGLRLAVLVLGGLLLTFLLLLLLFVLLLLALLLLLFLLLLLLLLLLVLLLLALLLLFRGRLRFDAVRQRKLQVVLGVRVRSDRSGEPACTFR